MERRDFIGQAAAGAAIAGFAAVPAADAQIRNIAAERNSLKAADFGALGNGVADDTSAIQKAIDEAHRIGGATIHLEGTSGRNFKCAGKINLDDKRGVRLSGTGGPNATDKTQLLFTGRTGPFISLRSSFGVVLQDLRIASAENMSGPLVTTGHSTAKADTMYLILDRCMFLGQGRGPDSLLDLSLCIISTVKGCQFIGGFAAINGGRTAYANAIQITETIFVQQHEVAIRNAGESWLISGCTFEPLSTGLAGALSQEKGKSAWGLTIIGCWMGDIEAAGGCWIDLSTGPAYGLALIGNRMASAGGGSGDTGVKLGPANHGVSIVGNRIEGPVCIDFTAPYTYGASIVGNDLQGRVPIANLQNAIHHFVAGQYTTENSMSGITNFGFGTFTGDGGNRAGIQLVPQYPPAKPQDGDLWSSGGSLFFRIGGQSRRVMLE